MSQFCFIRLRELLVVILLLVVSESHQLLDPVDGVAGVEGGVDVLPVVADGMETHHELWGEVRLGRVTLRWFMGNLVVQYG